MTYDFESLRSDVLRTRPGAKWAKARPGDGLAAWVADMDFALAPPIRAALDELIEQGDVGYPRWAPTGVSPMVEVFADRMDARFGWNPPVDQVVELAEVVQGIQVVLHFATAPGDGILLLTPIYPPFLSCGGFGGRHTVEVAARRDGDGWAWDRDEVATAAGRTRAMLLCHPHNPLGRVYERDELEFLAELAERHDLLIISDEIHADLVYAPGGHIPMSSLSAHTAARTVTITSTSKAFNLAGLRWAIAHVGPAELRAALADLPSHLLGVPNLAAVTASRAAWTESDDWLAAVVGHLDTQRHRLAALTAARLPAIDYVRPEATYLAWLDCRRLALVDEPYNVFAAAGVELSPGPNFGDAGRGFVRLNLATSSAVLDEIVDRVADAVATAPSVG